MSSKSVGRDDITTEEMVTLLTELDRGLVQHDVGNSVWYEDWKRRVAAKIGVTEHEINSRLRYL